jgi:hypothetical protein
VSDLRSVIRVKTMADAAASAVTTNHPSVPQGIELVGAYDRLRAQAQKLNTRAGWGTDDEFDEELPPLEAVDAAAMHASPRIGASPYAVTLGSQAQLRLRLLSAWAAGHQEAFELEEQMKANAEAKIEAAIQGSRRTGFA